MKDTPTQPATTPDPWREVAAVERELRLCAFTSAGDPTRVADMKMFALWAGRLQKAIGDAGVDTEEALRD